MTEQPRMIQLTELLTTYHNGDETSWYFERLFMEEYRPRRLAALTESIARRGMDTPIRIDVEERRVIDGNYRVIAAVDAGFTHVPVLPAYDGHLQWWNGDRKQSTRDEGEPDW